MNKWRDRLPWNMLSTYMVKSLRLASLFRFSIMGVVALFGSLIVLAQFTSFAVALKGESITTAGRIADSLSEKLISPLLVGDYETAQKIIDKSIYDVNILKIKLVVNDAGQEIVITPKDKANISAISSFIDKYMPSLVSGIAQPSFSMEMEPSIYQEGDFGGVDIDNIGRLEFSLDFADVIVRQSIMLSIAIFFILLSTLFILSLSRKINSSVSEPISNLLESIRTMGDHDFSHPIEAGSSLQPETDELIKHFVRHSHLIADRTAVLGEMIENMEDIISSRTMALEDALKSARQSAESKANFINIMSHELNQPLFSARMAINNMGRQPDAARSDSIQHYINIVNRHLDNARSQIEHVLEFTGKGRESYVPKQESFDFYQMVETLVASHSTSANCKGLYVDLIWEPHTPNMIISCPDGWRHIINNLIGNAVKYTKEGGATIVISTADYESPTRFSMVLEVMDTGVGIPAEHQDKIFEFYTQVGDATKRTEGGYGIGLGIVSNYVQSLGGRRSVTSSPKGSCFKIQIPVSRGLKPLGIVQASCVSMIEKMRLFFVLFDGRKSWRDGLHSRIINVSAHCLSTDSFEHAVSVIRQQSLTHSVVCIGRLSDADFMSSTDTFKAEQAQLIIGMSLTDEDDKTKNSSSIDFTIEESADIADIIRQVSECVLHSAHMTPVVSSPVVTKKPLFGKSILLVDDNLDNLKLTQEFLANYGADIHIAHGPEAGIDMALSNKYDALCIDIMMPLINGIEVAQRIRDGSINADSALFAFTAGYLDDEKMAAMNALDMVMIYKMEAREKMVKIISTAISL